MGLRAITKSMKGWGLPKMKKITLVLLLALSACSKKDKDEPKNVGGMPGMPTAVTTKYSGVLANVQRTDVATTAGLLNGDVTMAYVCMNDACDPDSLPAATCSEYGHNVNFAPGWQVAAICYTTSPSPYIARDTHLVAFVNNPAHDGYTNYGIKTIVYQ